MYKYNIFYDSCKCYLYFVTPIYRQLFINNAIINFNLVNIILFIFIEEIYKSMLYSFIIFIRIEIIITQVWTLQLGIHIMYSFFEDDDF